MWMVIYLYFLAFSIILTKIDWLSLYYKLYQVDANHYKKPVLGSQSVKGRPRNKPTKLK
jgi:hypothetical protein